MGDDKGNMKCTAGALAQKADCAFYTACPTAGEAGWAIVFKDDHEEDILQEDGETTKKVKITEAETLKFVVENFKAPPQGLWLGGIKHTVARFEKEQTHDDVTVGYIFAARKKGGCHIYICETQVLCVFFDEEKGQTMGNCNNTALEFAKWFKGEGY